MTSREPASCRRICNASQWDCKLQTKTLRCDELKQVCCDQMILLIIGVIYRLLTSFCMWIFKSKVDSTRSTAASIRCHRGSMPSAVQSVVTVGDSRDVTIDRSKFAAALQCKHASFTAKKNKYWTERISAERGTPAKLWQSGHILVTVARAMTKN